MTNINKQLCFVFNDKLINILYELSKVIYMTEDPIKFILYLSYNNTKANDVPLATINKHGSLYIIEFPNDIKLYLTSFDDVIIKLKNITCNYVIVLGNIGKLLPNTWLLRPCTEYNIKSIKHIAI